MDAKTSDPVRRSVDAGLNVATAHRVASSRDEITGTGGHPLPRLQLRDAKARLSALIDGALRGEPSVITRHGKPQVVVVSVAEWRRLCDVPGFGRLLMSSGIVDDDLPERDKTPLRDTDL